MTRAPKKPGRRGKRWHNLSHDEIGNPEEERDAFLVCTTFY